MRVNKRLIIGSIGLLIILGGCSDMSNLGSENSNNAGSITQEQHEKDIFVSVQSYKGEEYELNNGEQTGKIAKENKEEIEEAVVKYFQDQYKTEVIVHNMVGAVDGATVFVESVGEPHFHTFAIIPIDVKEKKIRTDSVWSQEGQVENAMHSGLFAMVFEEEINKLNDFISSKIEEYPIVGITEEALESVRAGGYSTPYYYTNTKGHEFDSLLESYLSNPSVTSEELKEIFNKESYSADKIIFTLDLYMEEANVEPSQEIFDSIVADLEAMEGLPKASYTVLLNDNRIDKKSAIGPKSNTLERSFPDYIIKE